MPFTAMLSALFAAAAALFITGTVLTSRGITAPGAALITLAGGLTATVAGLAAASPAGA